MEKLKNRIRQIRGADKKSIYELSLEIGISEHTLNNFLYGQSSKETQEKIRKFLEDYETKDEQIAELEAKIKKYATINEQDTKDYAELKAENEQLKKQVKQLEDFVKSSGEIDHINHEYTYKLKQTLQEIKEIVCGNYEIIDPQGRKDILKLITKAEEE